MLAKESAAMSLAGLELVGGWRVVRLLPRSDAQTGAHCSVSYEVKNINDGCDGFLKALDYTKAFREKDRPKAVKEAADRFMHERTLMELCRDKRLRRVIRALDSGSVDVPGFQIPVDYLIFERGVADLRVQIETVDQLDALWRLRTLHQIAAGMHELHGLGIAHQDLKPSNIVHFGKHQTKIIDLGRSVCRTMSCPYEADRFAGDRSYAPPELLYNYVPGEWIARRFGVDAYLLGSMIAFLFVGSAVTPLLVGELSEEFRPNNWGDGFIAVLPHLSFAFGRVLSLMRANISTPLIKEDLVLMVRELCEPDFLKRGHPKDRRTLETHYSLQRYVSKLDLLSKRVEITIK